MQRAFVSVGSEVRMALNDENPPASVDRQPRRRDDVGLLQMSSLQTVVDAQASRPAQQNAQATQSRVEVIANSETKLVSGINVARRPALGKLSPAMSHYSAAAVGFPKRRSR